VGVHHVDPRFHGLAPVDDYPDARDIGEPGDDHAPDDGGVDLDISGVVWGEAVE
jgi:hypothetical protein